MIKSAIGQTVDVVGVVLVGGQRHDVAEGGYVERRIVATDVALEVTYAAVAFEY